MKDFSAGVNRILVIEDEPAICELCRRVLSGEGFEVDIAGDGKTAQEMIAKRQYDLYLIDIRLPVMDGKELYLWLKEEHPHMTGRVIFTTGSVMGGDTQTFLERTGRPFLPKPFVSDDLKAIVSKTLKEIDK